MLHFSCESLRAFASGKHTRSEEDAVAEYGYTVLYEPLPEGGYQVIVPAIPEIVTFGRTIEEAREMATDAIRCFLESALKAGESIPSDVQTASEHLAVTLP
jgi:antitoxin HicB